MRNKTLKIAALAVCLVVLAALSGCASGMSSDYNPYSEEIDDSWTITQMNVKIDVNDDRSADVTEIISVRFNAFGKHGIYRDLATNSGEKYRGITVSPVDYTFERNPGLLSVRIGSEDDVYAFGATERYTINYTIIPPDADDADSYYMNVVGFGYSTKIEQVSVEMNFPAAPVNVEYVAGKYGATGGSGRLVTASENGGKRILISATGGLDAYEGITVNAALPENTMHNRFDASFLITLLIGLALICAVAAVKLTKGKNRALVPVSGFYPPEDNGKRLTPVRMGMLIDSMCSAEDVTSMIFYWASKGYLRLEEAGADMKIIKVCDLPPDSSAYETAMFSKLFSLGDSVFTDQLKMRFYTVIDMVKAGVTGEYAGRLYEKKVRMISAGMAVLTALYMVVMLITAYLKISLKYFNALGFIAIIPVAAVYAAGMFLSANWEKLRSKRKILMPLYALAAFALCWLGTLPIPSYGMGMTEKICLAVCGAVCSCIASFISRRTDYYNKVLGEIVGFRDFITFAEKDKLEMMLQDNPQYYYDVLPFANVLGVSDIWEDKFKDLTVPPPSYYNGTGAVFSVLAFNSFYRRSFDSFRAAATTRPAQSSRSGGGRSSGGGGVRGGGGFGGGGGRSW